MHPKGIVLFNNLLVHPKGIALTIFYYVLRASVALDNGRLYALKKFQDFCLLMRRSAEHVSPVHHLMIHHSEVKAHL